MLVNLGRSQRFGTQYQGINGEPMHLVTVEPGVTDAMRAALDCPTLQQAREREAQFQKPASSNTHDSNSGH